MTERERELELVLWAIEQLAGDDFGEDLELRSAAGQLTGDLEHAARRLGAIYMAAHSFLPHLCYDRHDDWRQGVLAARGDFRGDSHRELPVNIGIHGEQSRPENPPQAHGFMGQVAEKIGGAGENRTHE